MHNKNNFKVSIPSTDIWIPDVILFNSADGKYEITSMTRAKIYYSGVVVWEPPAIYKSSCTIDVEFFPFDFQHCSMIVGTLLTVLHKQIKLKKNAENLKFLDQSNTIRDSSLEKKSKKCVFGRKTLAISIFVH